ncbi:magnesium and cobalt transport protein CorA [Nakamurella flavida]|uniref:Magnesium and cobalt transport protein CorA n=1 Tax=Nakamurella flavida TaxID=363630 RepID=A0A938YL15_9ACTN|nr:magnesium and cobalt transport protein CorA [Nakamurella flavida]MBM9474983.1 magnesium and cobalt transport protein CorA [Nakamurella flavida]MDP9776552.1 magnesium transporter [Nakamurella flavida]
MPVLPSLPLRSVRSRRAGRHPGPATETPHGLTRRTAPGLPCLVDCAAYVDGVRVPGCHDPADALALVREQGKGFVWVGLHEPDEVDMRQISGLFGLHELSVEDAVHAYQRPKLDRYRSHLFLVLKTVRFVEHARADQIDAVGGSVEIVQTGEIMMFIGADFIITVRHGAHSGLAELRQRLESDPEHLALGPSAVAHDIADRIVDNYVTVVEHVEEDMDAIETAVFSPRTTMSVERIYSFKREIQELRRAVTPLAAPLRFLAHTPHDLVAPGIAQYFLDVEDHLAHVAERVYSFDELLTSLINALMAQVATRQNEDMRKISAWAAIALVPTAIAGIYGMNFEYMPELGWTFGYPMAIGLMVLVCAGLHRALRRKGWL